MNHYQEKTKTLVLIVLMVGPFLFAGEEKPTVYQITSVAGNGQAGQGLDGVLALRSELNHPTGIAVDKKGHIYIADKSHRIRKITPDGHISSVVGTGEAGFSGDGGLANKAKLNRPYGVRFDRWGNLWIADAQNHRVRKVDIHGVITTVAGKGNSGFSGDNGPAINASLSHPDDMIVDHAGNLYIADAGNDRVRMVTPQGIIKTIAGSGRLRFHGGSGFSGDGGLATKARLWVPASLALDQQGNLYVGDLLNHAIRKITPSGYISTIAGLGKRGFGRDGQAANRIALNEPGGLLILPDGSLVFSDGGNARIRRIAPDGTIQTIAGTGQSGFDGDGGLAIEGEISLVDHLAADQSGNIYFGDYDNQRIRKLHPTKQQPKIESEIEVLLRKMREAYQSAGNLRIRSTRQLRNEWISGELVFSPPNRIKVALNSEKYGKVEIVSDGYKIAVVDHGENQRDTYPYSHLALNRILPFNLEILCLFDWERQLSSGVNGALKGSKLRILDSREWKGKSWQILEEIAGTLKVHYYLNQKTFLIQRTVQWRDDKLIYDGWLEEIEAIEKINEKEFCTCCRN